MLRPATLAAGLLLSAGPALADEHITTPADTFLQTGILCAIIVVLATVVSGLGLYVKALWNARLEDHRDFSKQLAELNNEYNVSTHDVAKTTAAQKVAIDEIDSGAKARWIEAKGGLDRIGDKIDDKLDPLAVGVAANGTALAAIAADIRDMRNHALNQRGGGSR